MLELPDKNNLKFHLSVLAEEHAFIILSTGRNPHSDFVYWIIVDGWNKNYTTAIRRCPNGVPSAGYPQDECKRLRQEKNINVSI
jgi:hypothetical protein